MLLAAIQQVEKTYGEQTVLENAVLEIRSQDRIALIGRNGAGKSTLLRLLTGEEIPDAGSIYFRPDITVAMLAQDPHFENETIVEVSDRAFKDIEQIEQKLQALEAAGLDDPERYEQWEAVHERFERRGGYERRSRRDAVLYALGFRGREHEIAAHLSGGEKTRLGLAKLLMAQPDVLLLDEPTNHLDMEMREWLEGYLGRYAGGIIVVSHDRAFLDAACSSTAEVSLGVLRSFNGTPAAYRAYREEQLRIEAATRANQQKERERLANAASQMKKWAGQNAKLHRRAKSMERRVERFETQMIGDADPTERTTRFAFESDESGDIILQAAHLTKTFNDTPLFKDAEFTIRQGERIALVGRNGAGKSTFLKMLLGDLSSDDPRAYLRYGSRVRVGYYDQELRGVNPDNTLIEEMIRLVGDKEAHNLLGRFLFPYDAQYKLIKDLSGGERARLSLLKLTLGNNNFLVLDEPTNHLDVEMIEALEAALINYTGTLFIVSHDRRFISQVTSTIWEIKNQTLIRYEGDWDYYQYKRKQQETTTPTPTKTTTQNHTKNKTTGPSKWQLEQELESLEEEIAGLEVRLVEVSDTLAQPEALTPDEIAVLGAQHHDTEAALLEKMARWEEVTELLRHK